MKLQKLWNMLQGKIVLLQVILHSLKLSHFIGDKGKPIGMSMAWNSGGGHVLVMKGYT